MIGGISLIQRKFFEPRDFLFISCLIIGLSVFYIFTTRGTAGEGEKYAEVSLDGHTFATLSLNEDGTYAPAGMPEVRIAVRDGAVAFLSSDCPDKTCVHTGFLSRPGQSAACLPNRVVVRVIAGKGEALDSATY